MSLKNSIDWELIINELKQQCSSDISQDIINSLQPCESEKKALQSFSKIVQLKSLLLQQNRPMTESLDVFSTWFSRITKSAILKKIELRDIRHFCSDALTMRDFLQLSESDWPRHYYENIMNAEEPLSAIDQILTSDGEIRSDASETLYGLFKEKNSLRTNVVRTLDKLVKKHEMENILQDKYVTNREGRMVVPVKSGMQHDLEGIIHASSHSRQTVFMEPQLVIPMNNRLKQIEMDIEDEIESLLQQLSNYLHSLVDDFLNTKNVLLECDVTFAKAKLSLLTHAHPIKFSNENINLKNITHPILALNGTDVVPNSIQLNKDRRLLILTGPNAGGKTILLKSIGLAAQMARHGLLVCADEGSEIPFFSEVYMAVGDLQSVDENLSTFAGHLKILNDSLKANSLKQLLLIDEICGSTDPEEGSALARSFIKSYSDNNCFGVITSHLSPLKSGWNASDGIINGSLEYDSKTGQPTYQFIMGIAGESLAIQTARRVGVDKKILDNALSFLSPEHKKHQQVLEETEELKSQLIQVKQQLNDELKAAKKQKNHYQALSMQMEKDKQGLLKKEVSKAKKQIDEMIDFAKVDDTFKKHEHLSKVKSQIPQIIKSTGQPDITQISSAEDFAQRFPPGTKVFVETLGKDALVQSKPNNKGEVSVLSGSMQVSIAWESLGPAKSGPQRTGKVIKYHNSSTSYMESDRIVDLRGLSSQEALEQLELQLDTASVNEEDRVKVIHGHGTESLKRGVRQYLSRSVYVKKWYAGPPQQGGDGITWVEL